MIKKTCDTIVAQQDSLAKRRLRRSPQGYAPEDKSWENFPPRHRPPLRSQKPNSPANKKLSQTGVSTAQIARHSRRKAQPQAKQLTLWESQQKPETEYPLKIEPLPPALQWWEEEHFWLIHIQTGLRVPGSWTADEAKLIKDFSKDWDWSIDAERRVVCGLQLLALAEAVCKRSSCQKGGECNA